MLRFRDRVRRHLDERPLRQWAVNTIFFGLVMLPLNRVVLYRDEPVGYWLIGTSLTVVLYAAFLGVWMWIKHRRAKPDLDAADLG